MSYISYIEGDATEPICHPGGHMNYIAHICNDVNKWGKGFVLAISKKWPEPERRFKEANLQLGEIQCVVVEPNITVVNMCAQHDIRPIDDIPPIRYGALRVCLAKLAMYVELSNGQVHMPRIGCGLAGGRWDKVELVIKWTLSRVPVHVYDLPLKKR